MSVDPRSSFAGRDVVQPSFQQSARAHDKRQSSKHKFERIWLYHEVCMHRTTSLSGAKPMP